MSASRPPNRRAKTARQLGDGRNYATIHRMIENPIYGGAYAYGKTAVAAGYDDLTCAIADTDDALQ